MTVINTNIKSLISQNAIVKNNRDLSGAMQQLSTGKRINSAKDDAAGLAITSRMTAQIRGLDQAIRNGNDSVSMLQTTEGAMIEMTNMLQRMRELAVQSANDTYTQEDRNYLDLEFQQLKKEINRITRDTQWNGMDVMNGTFENDAGAVGKFRFQVGGNEGQIISHTIGAMGFVESTGTAGFSNERAQVSTVTITGTYAANDTATLKVVVGSTTETFIHTVQANATSIKDIAQALADKVNASTGGSALVNASVDKDGVITLKAVTAGTAGAFAITGSTATTAATGDTPALTLATTTAAAANATGVQYLTLDGTYVAGDRINMKVAGKDFSYTVSPSDLETDEPERIIETIAENIRLKASFIDIAITQSGAALAFTISPAAAFTTSSSVEYVNTNGALTNIKDLDIQSNLGSNNALSELDISIDRINQERAGIGAVINRLTYAVDNLANVSQNTSESRSRILDTDYAKASSELARTQIISQAATAMLAQANQSPQTVLQLLQG